MDGFWIFMIVAVTCWYVFEPSRARRKDYRGLKYKFCKQPEEEPDSRLVERLEKMERRVANLESLIVERNKTDEYERLKEAV